ncbi:hypothetical protein ALC56_12349 [Trachymyrmex septentrionalis]|uniref:Uncharacterized protein n=1 Tax=Trachymyrmex septentrionalis TaxID=34720 RepID=A0A195F0F3_9HYME|nr:hypothetical protein ALC56_12349 [Trachymyrmex septentrionalis]
MPPPYSPCLVKSPTGNVELKLQTYFSSYSHGRFETESFSGYKWASFAKASGLRAISTLNSARRESVKFARKCECDSGFFFSTSQAPPSGGLTSGDSFQLRNVWTNSKLNNIHSLARPSYVVKRKTSYSKQSLTTIAFTCTVRSKYGLL